MVEKMLKWNWQTTRSSASVHLSVSARVLKFVDITQPFVIHFISNGQQKTLGPEYENVKIRDRISKIWPDVAWWGIVFIDKTYARVLEKSDFAPNIDVRCNEMQYIVNNIN